ncbi:MAG: phosphoenolpyruvate carboxykinase (ATP) [Elusimicrobia bacterium]|nr:MAG: phosphoenolpyruvate carboxykinase (ATP) [Elusimicrobiota bacterium]KAF0154374.1 MAG: phosphoenolpyruvate carboxykinase (ATP) [Elusimicrobiota bacterium]
MPTEAAAQEKNVTAIKTSGSIHSNLSTPGLYEHAVARKEAVITAGGALCARTGKHTARSPHDRFVIKGASTGKHVWWNDQNVALDAEKFDALFRKVEFYISKRDLYSRDCYAGSDPKSRLSVRVYTELAWHSLFISHLLIKPSPEELPAFSPEFTVVSVPGFTAMPQIDGTRGSAFILLNFEKKLVLIGGTAYAGEIKKAVFTVMNYLLPLKGIMPMHCSANLGKKKDTAIFFGLSGTGKTTLSSDPLRRLIGDDEHGWSDGGIFNFEGGCYAKVINLDAGAEPQIHAATGRFGTVLENVVYDKATRELNLNDGSLTENTRAGYPLEFIDNSIKGPAFPHPKNIVMLTYDAFGVLPPISKLTPEQAMYHFISGYTAKVANTEMGVKEPRATFSTCFGAPFMLHHPSVYAELLEKKMKKHGAQCWLINTGLCGGPYGVGKRMSIQHTRALLNAALDGKLAKVKFTKDPVFGFGIPARCPGVPPEVLNPRKIWADKAAYDAKLSELAGLFAANFGKFEVKNKAILGAGPRV